jgi:hypothetical protein
MRHETLRSLCLELGQADLRRVAGLRLLHSLGGKLVEISIKVVACRKSTIYCGTCILSLLTLQTLRNELLLWILLGNLRKRRLQGSLHICLTSRLVRLVRSCLLGLLEPCKSLMMTFGLSIVRHFTERLVGADLRCSLLMQIGLLVLLEPIQTLHKGNVGSESGVLLVLQNLMQLPSLLLCNRLILRALKLVEALVRKIWRKDRTRIYHLGLLVQSKCGRGRQFVDGWGQCLSILLSAKSEADLSAEVLHIFNLALLWLIISLNRASNHLLISDDLLNSRVTLVQTPSSGWLSRSLNSGGQSWVHVLFGSSNCSERSYLFRQTGQLHQILAR